jgi:hypothetical protein
VDFPDFRNGLKAVLCELRLGKMSTEPEERLIIWGTAVAENPSKIISWNPEKNSKFEIETIPTTFGANSSLVILKNDKTGIAVGPGPLQGYPAWIKVFSLEPSIEIISDIAPYEVPNSCGVNLGAVDIDGDRIDELVIGEGTGPDRPPIVRICRINGELLTEWKAF